MADIAIDSSGQLLTNWSSGSSQTKAFNNVAGTYLIVVMRLSSNKSPAVTYNGVSMTKLVEWDNSANSGYYAIFGLNSPATGSNNIVITLNASDSNWWAAWESLTSVGTQTQPDSTGQQDSASSPCTATFTTSAASTWLVGIFSGRTGIGAGSSTTIRQDGTNNTDCCLADSNAVRAAGSNSLSVTTTSGGHGGLLVVALAPTVASSTETKLNRTLIRGVMRGTMRP